MKQYENAYRKSEQESVFNESFEGFPLFFPDFNEPPLLLGLERNKFLVAALS
ncbi:MAG: hypothetical protein ACREBD_15280 [Blastocatellia bacterium]